MNAKNQPAMHIPDSARRRVRVRSQATAAAVVGVAVKVPDSNADRVLIALHHRQGMQTDELAVMLATMPVTLLPVLSGMQASGALLCEPVGPTRGSVLLWKLTNAGAKQAVFALHRDKKNRPRSVFVGGINPWTGAKTRK